MSRVEVERQAEDRFRICGELTLATVPALERRALPAQWPAQATVTLDLSGVTRSDSAGLALLIEWLRVARRRNVRLRLADLPAQMREIARISDLLPILPLD